MLSKLTRAIGGVAHLHGRGHTDDHKLNQTKFELKAPHGPHLQWAWQPSAAGHVLATSGDDVKLSVYNANGSQRDTTRLKGPCRAMEWSRDGSALAVLNTETPVLLIYDGSKGRKKEVTPGFTDPLTCMAWSRTALLLACGSKAGNVLMFNAANGKSGSLEGKHRAEICGCAWSPDGQLAVCAVDNTLSLSHENGQTFAELKVRTTPSSPSYGRADNGKDSLLAVKLGSEAVFVLNVDRKDGPVELTFSERYGPIVDYKWYDRGLMMIGFVKGCFCLVSSNPSNMGTELFQVRDYRSADLTGIAICPTLGLCATISGNSIRTHHLEDPTDIVGSLEVQGERKIEKIDWSDDGAYLTVSTEPGNLYTFPGSIKHQAPPSVAKADDIAKASKTTKNTKKDGDQSQISAARLYTLHSPHGPGIILFAWQRRHGTYMATTGYNQMVNIYDRMGTMVDQIALPGNCTGFGWDMNGDILAVINEKNSAIILWDANYSSKTRVRQLDSGLRDPLSSLIWSRSSAYLAVGTSKGNLMIYNHQTSRRIPIMGKHTRRITCGAWNKQNLLALGGEDKTLSISNEFGDTMRMATLRAEPSQIQFSEMKMDGASDGENTISFIAGKKSLQLLNYLIEPPKDPTELTFKDAYGQLVAHEWFGDGYILLGFSSGYFVAISSHIKEIGTELFQIKNHKTALTDIAVNLALSKAASCGDNTVKIHELQEMKEIWAVLSLDEEKSVDQVEWSDDGQLLAVGCGSGNLHVYLSSLPILGGASGTRIAVLTSLLEVTIIDYLRKEEAVPFTVDVEPSFLGIGPFHLIVGMNNRAWIYLIGETGSPELLRDREYLATVDSVRLNADYASILCDGVIQLHVLEQETGEAEEREGRLFPDPEHRDMKISCHYTTADFLIYGTDTGQLVFFFLEDWAVVNEYRHTMGIRAVYPEVNGTRVVFVDERSEGHIFNPVTDLLERIVKFPSQALGVVWENYPLDRNVFIAWDRTTISTFVYTRENIDGNVVDMVDTTPLPAGQTPLLLYNGEVTLQTCSGRVTQLVLASHEMEANVNQYEEKELTTALKKNIALRRYKDAWTVAQALDKEDEWRQLGEACMKDLQIDIAMRVYKQMGDVGMLWSLETIRDIEDIKLLAGYVAMFLGNFDQAQTSFLMSTKPVAALEMRRDLLQWEMALQLASKLAPDQIPDISREYAHQLEFTGEHQQALQNYDRGLELATEESTEEHKAACTAGIARCSIRVGDIRKGVQLAMNSPSKLLKKECAEILEGMKQYNEAAVLFEKAGLYDRAAQMYIKLKNWTKVADLLPQVQSLKIHSQYAKAREAEGKYKEALAAYETAREYDSMVRILLDHLNNPQQAVAVVQQSKSVEGARLVAKFFMKMGDFESAIQFLVMSKCIDEAFTLAQKHGKMDTFAAIIGNDGRPEDYKSMALHYENSMNYFLAGKFHHLAGDSTKALKLLLKAANGAQEADAIMLAIEVVGEANSEGLAKQLIDFLLGEQDGVPKDPKYLFRLYMARKMYRESAKTAVIIAKEEQKVGSYRNAHDMLLGMYQELRKHKIRVPNELASNMMMLHSYILARIHVKRNEHLKAARLLIRVANNISKFPAHTVPILTSTVIECQRSGLKKSSFQFAATLMKPEYRDVVDAKYRKKIEAVVRKPAKTEEEEFPAACPFCDNMIAETELNCDKCKRTLPYCIATGRHVIKDDLTECPFCNFPAIRSELAKFVESEDPCPMCNKGPIGAGELRIYPDPAVFLPLMGEE